MVPGKDFDSPALVGRHPRYLQNNCGKAGNLRGLRLRQLFQTSQVLLRNMGLLHKTEDIVPVFDGPALALGQALAAFAHVNFVTPAGKLLVRPHTRTDPAIVSHSSSSFSDQSADHKPNSIEKGARCAVIVSFGGFAQTQVARSFERPDPA